MNTDKPLFFKTKPLVNQAIMRYYNDAAVISALDKWQANYQQEVGTLRVETPSGFVPVNESDYIVRFENGSLLVMSSEVFNSLYEIA